MPTSSRTVVFQALGALNLAKKSPHPFMSFNLLCAMPRFGEELSS